MRKVCKSCKLFVVGDICPLCKNKQVIENWKGRIVIINAEESKIAQKLDIKVKGEYAIKI